MIPMRFLFRSRWAALLWAGGICLTAYHHAKSAKMEEGNGNVADVDASKGLGQAVAALTN